MRAQRRGRSIAMSPEETDAFLLAERTCRVASVGGDGVPHLSALWFVWDGSAIWLNSVVRSQRWTNLVRNPAVSVLVDAGREYGELRGVQLSGHAEPVGEIPRVGQADESLVEPERRFARKYAGSDVLHHDGRHAWLRIAPTKIVSWDFGKRPTS